MPDAYATAKDVANGWRPLSSEEFERASVLVARASRLVRAKFTTLDARIARGDVDPLLVADVVAGMARRAMLAPEGVIQHTQTGGPFTESRRYANPTGRLDFTADDLAVLSDAGGSRRAFSLDLAPQPATPYLRDV